MKTTSVQQAPSYKVQNSFSLSPKAVGSVKTCLPRLEQLISCPSTPTQRTPDKGTPLRRRLLPLLPSLPHSTTMGGLVWCDVVSSSLVQGRRTVPVVLVGDGSSATTTAFCYQRGGHGGAHPKPRNVQIFPSNLSVTDTLIGKMKRWLVVPCLATLSSCIAECYRRSWRTIAD